MTEPVCPYCRMPFEENGPARIFCTACGTPHHEDCYRENGGCTVFGCARAPADDPKLQVSQSDLSAVAVPAARPYAPYAPPAQPYIAQPQVAAPRGTQYPPSMYSGPLGLSQAAAPAPALVAAPAEGQAVQQQPASPPSASASPQPPPPPTPPAGTYFYPQPAAPATYAPPALDMSPLQKSRTTYIVLGIFLGALGVHNFYAGYTGRAVGQLCLTVLTLGVLAAIAWPWAIIEICIMKQDGQGIPFK